ncbi:dysbindin [Anoplophora glabripennis]|uniref:Dysbindin n=1 Tax=Anoplophora glabripennis TaxID=217634 RepID=V5I7N4_ANOGL|nr:dysbindin [Anoplophora glabripennis]
MLSSLKEKILNVKQNVPLFNTEGKEIKEKEAINLYAGADILQHFQNQWEELHQINEDNAKKAEIVAQDITKITSNITCSKENLSLITHILSNSNLPGNIGNCLENIKSLYTLSDKIESGLIDLENLIDEIEFEKLKVQHQFHLQQYELRKEESLESFKNTLEENHTRKVAEYEAKKKSVMEERQKAFQDAFKSDLEVYKSLGTLPEINQRKQNGALLEEIQIDYDPSELDQFFNENS